MKIGIYLAYAPARKFSIVNDGLGRYLAQLVRLLHNEGNEITIACPLWSLEGVKELFEEYSYPLDEIEFVTPRAMPVLWRIFTFLGGERPVKHKGIKAKIVKAAFNLLETLISFIATITSSIQFSLIMIVITILAVLSIPLVLLLGVLVCVVWVINKLFKVNILSISNFKGAIKKTVTLNGALSKLMGATLNAKLFEKMRLAAANQLIMRISKMKDAPDIWYCPMAFWTEFNDIGGVTVSCFPDLSTAIFPQAFSQLNVLDNTRVVRETVKTSKYFITYCDYQRTEVMSATLGVKLEKIKAIHLFVNETLPDVDVSDVYAPFFDNSIEHFSRDVLITLSEKAPPDILPYFYTPFQSFSFKDVRYIFYSSQNRPNKNLLTLIRAYEYLLREKEADFKLFITGSFDSIPEIKEYVYSKRLQYDILSFTGVTNQQLAALYACAELVVNPTLYEGGFLMVFSEGMSVGTPSIMGNIPQVTDVTKCYDMDDCLFDPFDYKQVAEKILYGIENHDALYETQKPLYDALSARNLNSAGAEYTQAFQYFIELDKKEKAKTDV